MNRLVFLSFLLVFVFFSLLLRSPAQGNGTVWVFKVKGAIGPATADYLERGLEAAQEEEVPLVVLKIDTPGGLDSAMREMVQTIISSPIPIVTYVAPSGARAASAGTYILYASHVAAMAPATNLGAATPVQISGFSGLPTADAPNDSQKNDQNDNDLEESAPQSSPSSRDTMTHKMVNDAEAYLRSLAQMHGRNQEWAVKAVRESASLSAEDALETGVIDLIAPNVGELLNQINARSVKVLGVERRLVTSGLEQKVYEPDWRNRLLSVITDPNVAYILMLLGFYGLFFELANPGSLFPGIIGGISLLLALFAFQVLPVNYAGIALILLGVAFMAGEAFTPSFGALGIGGLVAFIIGSVILMDTEVPDYTISRPLIGGLGLINVAFFIWVFNTFIKMRQRPVVIGWEDMIGKEGQCLSNEGNQLRVYVHSETWNARASTPITPGQYIKVTGINGLILTVEAIDESRIKHEEKF